MTSYFTTPTTTSVSSLFQAELHPTGLNMETQESLTLMSLSDIPLGHKVALKDFDEGDTVIKYGNSIGKTTATIKLGEHLHVHNAKTKRW